MEIREGQIIDGLFQITQKEIGKGGCGELHLAKNPAGKSVVLKFLHVPKLAADPNHLKREYKNLLKFSHPNVAKAFHLGVFKDSLFIASEFVEGEEFRNALMGKTPPAMIPYFLQALEGLAAIHNRRMLHIDIKSSNVLITKEGVVKIIDFGMALPMQELDSSHMSGTPLYMPPEMILEGKLDPRSDLFSFGVLMYYCITGTYPFRKRMWIEGKNPKEIKKQLKVIIEAEEAPKPPSEFRVNCPTFLDEIILTLLRRDPAERYPNARAVIHALKAHHSETYTTSKEAKGSYFIPSNNIHVGRYKEQQQIFESLKGLLERRQPENAIYWISGEEGFGKSHLLSKIKEKGEENAEKISIHFLQLAKREVVCSEFPASRELWLEAWLKLLEAQLAESRKPILILVDDWNNHYDQKLTSFFQQLLNLLNEKQKKPVIYNSVMPILFVFTTDRKEKPFFFTLPFVEVNLKPFSKEEIRDFLRATPALENKNIPEEWVESLFAATAGSPKELKDWLTEKHSRGLLFGPDGEILMAQMEDSSVSVWENENVPESTEKRLSQDLALFSAKEQELLQIISVWCYKDLLTEISLNDLQALHPDPSVPATLQRLVAKEQLQHNIDKKSYSRPAASPFLNWIYKGLDEEKRKKWHERIAQYLGSNKHFPKEAQWFHEVYGSNIHSAFKAALRLGNRMLYEKGQAAFAKEIFNHVLEKMDDVHPKASLFFAARLIEASVYTADYHSATTAFPNTNSFPKALQIVLINSILPALIEQQKFREAEALIQIGLDLANKIPSVYFTSLLKNFQARIFYKQYFVEKEDPVTFLLKAKAIYEESEKISTKTRNNDLGLVLQALGDHQGAISNLQKKLELLKKMPNLFIELTTLTALADACRQTRRYENAIQYAEAALEKARKTNQGKWILYTHHILGGIHLEKGLVLKLKDKQRDAKNELEEAVKEYNCCLAASFCLENKTESLERTASILLNKGQCLLELKKWDEAQIHLQSCLDHKAEGVFQALALTGLGECQWEMGKKEKAVACFEQAKPLVAKLPDYLSTNYLFKIFGVEVKMALKEMDTNRAMEAIRKMRELSLKNKDLAEELKLFQKEVGGETKYATDTQNSL